MPNPFTIRIYVPEGDPEGIRIIDRLSSNGKFFVFPRNKWNELRERKEFLGAGIYILTGYSEQGTVTDAESLDILPTVYVGQADVVQRRIDQQLKDKDFWDKAIVYVSENKINSTHVKWLEYALIKKLNETKRSISDNGNSPSEPTISESERAEIQVLLTEIYQTVPLVGVTAFESSKIIVKKEAQLTDVKDTIVVPAQEEGFNRVFLGENSWFAIRISGGMLENIRYIAGYQTAPISAITHYAEVKSIEPYGEGGKYKVNFVGPAIKLDQKIENDLPKGGMQGPRYTSASKLLKTSKMSGLF